MRLGSVCSMSEAYWRFRAMGLHTEQGGDEESLWEGDERRARGLR